MKASIIDMRRRMKDVLSALDRNEPVTVTYRGKDRGVIYPIGAGKPKTKSIAEHPAVGMWRDREDMKDVDAYVRGLRKSRHAV
jgi:hypothetical protein